MHGVDTAPKTPVPGREGSICGLRSDHPMNRGIAGCLAFFLAASLPVGGLADTAGSPQAPPSPAATLGADACPITVLAVLPVKSVGTGTTYAAFLSSPDGPGEASGTLWVNTPDGAFHVPFKRRDVTNRPYTEALGPIVFRLPTAAALDNVFLDSLDDPQPAPCAIANTWVPGITQNLVPDLLGRLRHTLAADPVPIDATPITDPAAACHSGGAPPATLIAVPPSVPAILVMQHPAGNVYVRLKLAADSTVISAVVDHSDSALLETAAIDATKKSVFVTETVNCRPRPSEYMYVVTFV